LGEHGGGHQADELGPVDLGPAGDSVEDCCRPGTERIDEVAGDLGVFAELETEGADSGPSQLGGDRPSQ
jgi:hypothetical protein